MSRFHHNGRVVQCSGFRTGLEETANFGLSLGVGLLEDGFNQRSTSMATVTGTSKN
jgi:hypothetical protein